MNRSSTISAILLIVMLFYSTARAELFHDDLGRKIEIHESPVRIISLAPSITEILYFIHLGDRIVGVTDFCNYPEEVKGKDSIGWIISPDIEKIVVLKPDLVFATAEGNRQDIAETLERIRIPLYVLDPHNLEDIFREITEIGKITNQDEISGRMVEKLKERVEVIKENVKGKKPVRVLYLASIDPIISAGPGSFIHDIIDISGGKNIAGNAAVRYPKIDMEEIILQDPEVIIVPPDITGRIQSWKGRWPGISAIKNNRIYSIDPDVISRPGPRIVDGLEQIHIFLHGDR